MTQLTLVVATFLLPSFQKQRDGRFIQINYVCACISAYFLQIGLTTFSYMKARFIAKFSSCTTTEVSILFTSSLFAIKSHAKFLIQPWLKTMLPSLTVRRCNSAPGISIVGQLTESVDTSGYQYIILPIIQRQISL